MSQLTLSITGQQAQLLLLRHAAAQTANERYTDVVAAIVAGHGYLTGTLVSFDAERCTMLVDVPEPTTTAIAPQDWPVRDEIPRNEDGTVDWSSYNQTFEQP